MTRTFRKLLLATACLAALPTVAHAEDASPLTFNVGAVTDYRYRGISQSKLKPAIQGGLDYTMNGFYVGLWASSIKWISEVGGDADVEIDLYGGYKGEIVKDLGYDIGVLTYQYPGNKLGRVTGFAKADTTEIYGALTYGPATVKYSHAVSNTFGNPDSKSSYYLDLSAGFDVGSGVMVTPHVGHQRIDGPNSGACSYWDGSVTVSKDFNGLVPSLMVVGNSKIQDACYTVNGKDLAKTTVVLGIKYNF